MARNKNRKRDEVPGVFPAALAMLLGGAIVVALSYLWLCGRCDSIGRRIKQFEQQKLAVERARVNEEFQWSNMTSPQNMEKLLKAHGLEMSWPAEKNVVRIHRRLGDEDATPSPSDYAQGEGTWVHE